MKRFLLVIFIIPLISIFSFSQSELMISNKKHGKIFCVELAKKIKVKTFDKKKIKGKITVVNDSTFSIERDTFLISELKYIKLRTKRSRINGGITTGIGSAGVLGSIAALHSIENTTYSGLFGSLEKTIDKSLTAIAMTSSGIIAITGTAILSNGTKFKSKRWNYSFVK